MTNKHDDLTAENDALQHFEEITELYEFSTVQRFVAEVFGGKIYTFTKTQRHSAPTYRYFLGGGDFYVPNTLSHKERRNEVLHLAALSLISAAHKNNSEYSALFSKTFVKLMNSHIDGDNSSVYCVEFRNGLGESNYQPAVLGGAPVRLYRGGKWGVPGGWYEPEMPIHKVVSTWLMRRADLAFLVRHGGTVSDNFEPVLYRSKAKAVRVTKRYLKKRRNSANSKKRLNFQEVDKISNSDVSDI